MKKLKALILFAIFFLSGCSSINKPQISLAGPRSINVFLGGSYSDPGVKAYDREDGDISNMLIIDDSNLNLHAVGSYQIIYYVYNSKKVRSAAINRTVNVIQKPAYIDELSNAGFFDPLSMQIKKFRLPADYQLIRIGKSGRYQTIKEALDHITGDETAVLELLDPVHIENRIKINKNVIIKSENGSKVILKASDDINRPRGRMFIIGEEADVTLYNLEICNANPIDEKRWGGVALNYGILRMYNCRFYDNQANGGGVVYNIAGKVYASDCRFSNNLGDRNGPAGHICGSGGVIKNTEDGIITLINSTFDNNKSLGKGGAVHSSCSGTITAVNCSFYRNHANSRGGALNSKNKMNIVHCTFLENSSDGKDIKDGMPGGGISLRGEGMLYLSSSIFSNNKGNDIVLRQDGKIFYNQYNIISDNSLQSIRKADLTMKFLDMDGIGICAPGKNEIETGIIPPDFTLIMRDQRGVLRNGLVDAGAYESSQE